MMWESQYHQISSDMNNKDILITCQSCLKQNKVRSLLCKIKICLIIGFSFAYIFGQGISEEELLAVARHTGDTCWISFSLAFSFMYC